MGFIGKQIDTMEDLGYKLSYNKIMKDHNWQCKVGERIGKGGYARVYKAIDISRENQEKATGKLQEYALKIIDGKRINSNTDQVQNELDPEQIKREIEIMRDLNNCGYTVPIVDFIIAREKDRIMGDRDDEDMAICIIKMPLYKTFRPKTKLEQKDVIRMGIDICEALKAMAARKYLHRDVSPSNIFFDSENNRHRLGDFGISKEVKDFHNTNFHVHPWFPPELAVPAQREEVRRRLNADLYSIAACMAIFLGCPVLKDRLDDRIISTSLDLEMMEDDKMACSALIEVIRKGLSPFEQRYQTADEMQEDLRAIQAYMKRHEGRIPDDISLKKVKEANSSSRPPKVDYAEEARNALRNGDYVQAHRYSQQGCDEGASDCTALLAYCSFLLIRLGMLESGRRAAAERMLSEKCGVLEQQVMTCAEKRQRKDLMRRWATMKYLLAVSNYETGNVAEFCRLAESAAEKGSVVACYVCGRGMYAGDRPFRKNKEKGWEYLMRAAEAGYGAALSYVQEVQRSNPLVKIPDHIQYKVSACSLTAPKHQLEDILLEL